MTSELKKKWVAALRSGDYKQAEGYLHTHSNHYCCLGVLCNINDPSKWVYAGEYYQSYQFNGQEKAAFVLPLNHRFGLSPEEHEKCFNMNDRGNTFEEIADWIEQNVQESEV